MDFYFGFLKSGQSKVSWMSLTFLYSMLYMWCSVECWSYYYSNTTMNWEEARAWCQQSYTDMVAIQNQEEIKHLNSWLPKKSTYYWIGIRKINNVWTWVGTNKALTVEATNWAKGEPNNGKQRSKQGKNEDCVEMYVKRDQQPGKWNDERCDKLKTALCYTAACKEDSCLHGECVETINSHKCECFEGFYGEKCDQVVQCDGHEVTVPNKGHVHCSDKYGEFSYDSLCQFSCEEGYHLSTETPMRCTASKTWSQSPPTCELDQCEPLTRPDKGSVECSDPLGPSSYQSSCVFSCDEGFELIGAQSSRLQCESSGRWNDSQPSCVAVQCSPLLELLHGSVSCGEGEGKFSYEGICSFTCTPSYRLVGASTVTCTSAGVWSDELPHCEAVRCQKPEGRAHLVSRCSHTDLRLNSTCTFSCDEGFELQGSTTTQCSETGSWSEDTASCKPVQCPALQELEHGSVSCGGDSDVRFGYGITCSFSCNTGFELLGAKTTQCSEDGQWSADKPTCKAIECPAPVDVTQGQIRCVAPFHSSPILADAPHLYGTVCTFSCDKGFELQGSTTTQCSETGSWSEDAPSCKSVQCPALQELEHGSVSCGGEGDVRFGYGITCSFSCHTGFELLGAKMTQCSEDGQWSADKPTCKAIECPAPVDVTQGQIRCVAPFHSSPVSAGAPHLYGTVCTFSCDEGHELQGALSTECAQSGQWTSTPPTCSAVRCSVLEAPDNGLVNCSDAEPVYNSQCSFTCSQDHTLHGQETLTCDHHGNWTGTTPVCQAFTTLSLKTITIGATTGAGVALSGLSLVMWLLKRLKRKGNKFELNSNSDIEVPPQVYKNSTDSLI
ncbi:E-selectin-like isoform X2 [Thalassophryne amazonica]|uniref:E-selectin-like isoform X2 n=1 Tax=Thalassophryne amazonica TaxID=390379 RepID=UPI0014715114|nr:E-selectin-like isoform X2 [Thalassophryne amazonica]